MIFFQLKIFISTEEKITVLQRHVLVVIVSINPYLTKGFSHQHYLGESTFIFRGIMSDFIISFNFL